MSWLLDTNVVSELRKGYKADSFVRSWAQRTCKDRQAISVLTLGEIRKGIEQLRGKDSHQAETLDLWLLDLTQRYKEDILPVCEAVSDEWGRLNMKRTLPVIDGLLAATARVYGLTIATRNISDFEGVGVTVVNPFAPST